MINLSHDKSITLSGTQQDLLGTQTGVSVLVYNLQIALAGSSTGTGTGTGTGTRTRDGVLSKTCWVLEPSTWY